MCAKLLACPLCSQPGFLTLDALRAGLVSVATRPLACPVCNDVLLGIDKLTIHLFGHTINKNNNISSESPKTISVTPNVNVCTMVRNVQNIPLHAWNILKSIETKEIEPESFAKKKLFPSLQKTKSCHETSCLEENNSESESQNQELIPKTPGQVIFLQNVTEPDQVYTAKLVDSRLHPEISVENPTRVINSQTKFQTNDIEKPTVVKDSIVQYRKNEETASINFQSNVPQEQKEQSFSQPVWTENNSSKTNLHQFSLLIDYENSSNIPITSENLNNRSVHFRSETSTNKDSARRQESLLKVDIADNQDQGHTQALPHLKNFDIVSAKEKTERCDICGFSFPDLNILTLHKQVVHVMDKNDVNIISEHFLKNYPCHLCSKIFKMRGSLMVHMRVAHTGYGSLSKNINLSEISNENGYNCPTCGKNFKKEQHVMQHLKTHDGKQWECDVCSKMFTTKYFLKKHKRLHSGEMPYKCNLCDKTFTFQQSYHKHRLYHKDDKPHMCNTCGRSFKELSTLHNHERIHTGEKPFACETCGKCFRQRVSYLVHRRIHTGVMPYKCTACGKSFRYKVSQRTHKCPMQPPGTVVQHSNNLVQSLLQNTEVKDMCSKILNGDEAVSIVQQNQEVQNINVNLGENRYVLIVNNQGQHILTRQVETDHNDLKSDKGIIENDKIKSNSSSDVGISKNMFTESEKNITTEKTEYEKSHMNETRDFFSMVISPLNNDLSSPSTEMEHLRLSSPVNVDKTNETSDNFIVNSNNLDIMGQEEMQQTYDSTVINSSLQTINEESLKELLYGITNK